MRRQLEHLIAQPRTRRYATPLLLLHGAWHGAWCWEDALADFARRGFEAHAVSLRGHGRSDRPRNYALCGMEDYVRDLASAVRSISPLPVVVAHSLGGTITQLFLRKGQLAGLVLLCARPLHPALRTMRQEVMRRPIAALGFPNRAPELVRSLFFRPDIAPDDLTRYTSSLVAEPRRIALEVVLGRLPSLAAPTCPLLMIAAERDLVFTLDEQRATAEAYGRDLCIVPEAAHDLMLDPAWLIAADVIEGAVAGWEG